MHNSKHFIVLFFFFFFFFNFNSINAFSIVFSTVFYCFYSNIMKKYFRLFQYNLVKECKNRTKSSVIKSLTNKKKTNKKICSIKLKLQMHKFYLLNGWKCWIWECVKQREKKQQKQQLIHKHKFGIRKSKWCQTKCNKGLIFQLRNFSCFFLAIYQ